MTPVTIHSLNIENVKRVVAVELVPSEKGLTVIGGKNGAGKTTVLDSIMWALGGEKYRPSEPHREGSMTPPHITLTLSNGLKVERKGKNGALTVTDPSGKKAGQRLLDEFVSAFALDLPKFVNASAKEKAETLLQILGIGDQLRELDLEIARIYAQRTAIGQERDRKAAYADTLPEYPDAPDAEISVAELSARLTEAVRTNAQNAVWQASLSELRGQAAAANARIAYLKEQLAEAEQERDLLNARIASSEAEASLRTDIPTDDIEAAIAGAERVNEAVRANLTKEKALEDAEAEAARYNEMTVAIEKKRTQRIELLNGANLPLPGLTVEDGELRFNGHAWDGMSGAEQLRVATAIVRCLNPNCGFVLLDKLEQMDTDTLAAFGEWLEAENLQAIATRVSTGEECSIIIEAGTVRGADDPATDVPAWKKGEF